MFDDVSPAQNAAEADTSPLPVAEEAAPVINEHGDNFTNHNFDQNYGNEIQIYEAQEGKSKYESAKMVEFSKNGVMKYIDEQI